MIEYLRENKQCIGYLGMICTNTATEGEPKCLCKNCDAMYNDLKKGIRGVTIDAIYFDELTNWEKDDMTIYECFCQQKEMTADQCQNCFKKEMKEKYQTRAACVEDNAEKKEGSTF